MKLAIDAIGWKEEPSLNAHISEPVMHGSAEVPRLRLIHGEQKRRVVIGEVGRAIFERTNK